MEPLDARLRRGACADVQPGQRRDPARDRGRLDCRGRRGLPPGRGRHLAFPRAVDDALGAAVALGPLGPGARALQGVRHHGALVGDGAHRRLPRARSGAVLRLLGGDAHPDVLPDRDLGRRAARLRRDQVLPLHDGHERVDAGRHHRPLRVDGDVRLDGAQFRIREPQPDVTVLGLSGVCRCVCGQGAHLAAPQLAPRRLQRSPDHGDDSLVGAHVQGRLVRADPLRPVDLPRRGRDAGALSIGAGPGRRRLRGVRGHGPARPEAPHCLLQRQPPGPGRRGDLRLRDAQHGGQRPPDGQSRHLHRGALPRDRDFDEPLRQSFTGRDGRSRERDAQVRRVLSDHSLCLRGPAGHERLRRRVPHPRRHVCRPVPRLRHRWGVDRGAVGHLHALHGAPGLPRAGRRARPDGHERPVPRRNGPARSLGGSHPLDRPLSVAVFEPHRAGRAVDGRAGAGPS